jgi:hypothetical protein
MGYFIVESPDLFWVKNARPYWTWVPDVVQIRPCASNFALVDLVNRVMSSDLTLFGYAERCLLVTDGRNFYQECRGIVFFFLLTCFRYFCCFSSSLLVLSQLTRGGTFSKDLDWILLFALTLSRVCALLLSLAPSFRFFKKTEVSELARHDEKEEKRARKDF